ncbi:tyrosine-type recombinase/integrase [Nonomuraea indica]|uniref:Tyrosine-type recombinase/integrase n=1 Tax=Nonomuraea indica TaxID=1581193 RepID=A0ABW8ADN5_9ACTN
MTKSARPLIGGGYLHELPPERTAPGAGRPVNPLAVTSDREFFVGVKIGADTLYGTVCDLRAQVRTTASRPLGDRSPGAVCALLADSRAVAKTTIHRLLSRRDIPLREKTLWRMLYETAARAAEILALNVEDLDLEHRRAPVRSKGGAIEWVYWDSGTAHLLPRLLRLPDGSPRMHGPLFLSERRPVPARRPAAADICPHTGRARLGYDRARVLLDTVAGLDLHQLRHSAATHLGEAEVPLQLIMGKTRHKNPRTAMRYVKPGAEAIAGVTEHLAPPRRRH